MKRFLYFVLAILFIAANACLESCDSYVEKFESKTQELRQQRIEEHITDLEENLHNVKFDGHLYVVYTEKNGYGFGAAMVHSPNCECNKEINK